MQDLKFTAVDENGKEYVFQEVRDGNRIALTLPKEEFQGASTLTALSEFGAARVGDEGFYLMPRSIEMMGDIYTTFRPREDVTYRYSHPIMAMHAFRVNDLCAMVRVERNYKYYYQLSVKDGVYRAEIVFDFKKETYDPVYDDIRLEVILMPADSTMGDLARMERQIRLSRGEIVTLEEKLRSPAVEYARKYPLIRIRMGWKPSPSEVVHQTVENEPEMYVACSFRRVCDIADELRRQGVEGAELQLVGWNRSGHDGRFPQLFPVDPRLGGDEGLKEAIDHVKALGYRISLHTNLIDEYEIADTFTWDDICVGQSGEYVQLGHYSGGYAYHVCPTAQRKNFDRDYGPLAELGLDGIHFTDVISIVEPDSCQAAGHPSTTADGIRTVQGIMRDTRVLLGAFSSEGTMDFALKDLDYGLYVCFGDGFGKKVIPFADHYYPFFELTYHGILLYNPMSPTVNYTIKDARERLLLFLRGGRPSFYIYSRFRTGGKANWMGEKDLLADTDEQLQVAVRNIASSFAEYNKVRDLQAVFMKEYDVLGNGIEVATYENGARIVGNFGNEDAAFEGTCVPAGEVLFLV